MAVIEAIESIEENVHSSVQENHVVTIHTTVRICGEH